MNNGQKDGIAVFSFILWAVITAVGVIGGVIGLVVGIGFMAAGIFKPIIIAIILLIVSSISAIKIIHLAQK